MPGTPDTDMWGAVSQSDTYLTTNSLAAGSKLSVPERQKEGRPIGRPPFYVTSILSDAVGLTSAPGFLPAGAISRIGARRDRCFHYRFDMTVRHQEIRPVTMAAFQLIDASRISGITQVSSVISEGAIGSDYAITAGIGSPATSRLLFIGIGRIRAGSDDLEEKNRVCRAVGLRQTDAVRAINCQLG